MVVKVVLTGFSSFPGVPANPTECLLQEINALAAAGSLDLAGCGVLHSGTVLRVAAVEVRSWLDSVTQQLCKDLQPADKVVLIHLGTDVKSTCLKLETTAYNNATFRVPDVDGWQPSGEMIVDHEGAKLDEAMCTSLDIQRLHDTLHYKDKFNVQISNDPGRYVCNWTYFLSLFDDQLRGCGQLYSLFVHVPPFSCITQEEQLRFVVALLQCMCRQLSEEDGSGVVVDCVTATLPEGVLTAAPGVKAQDGICVAT